jgi:hypothetical protein
VREARLPSSWQPAEVVLPRITHPFCHRTRVTKCGLRVSNQGPLAGMYVIISSPVKVKSRSSVLPLSHDRMTRSSKYRAARSHAMLQIGPVPWLNDTVTDSHCQCSPKCLRARRVTHHEPCDSTLDQRWTAQMAYLALVRP